MGKYFKHKITNLINVSKVITVHYLEYEKDFEFLGEKHDFWEMVYADTEDIICSADNKSFTLKKGQAVFHKPNEFHTLKANGINAPNVFIISFECRSEAIRFFENKIVDIPKKMLPIIYYIISEAKKTFNIPFSDPNTKKMELLENPLLGGAQLIKNFLEILLIVLMRGIDKNSNQSSLFINEKDFRNNLTKTIIDILHKNIYNSYSIDDIANEVKYCKSYIFREFKKNTGKSIIEYYNNLKIEQAKILLRENNYSISQISELLCFDTPNYFSKTFKKFANLTPQQYKKRQINISKKTTKNSAKNLSKKFSHVQTNKNNIK